MDYGTVARRSVAAAGVVLAGLINSVCSGGGPDDKPMVRPADSGAAAPIGQSHSDTGGPGLRRSEAPRLTVPRSIDLSHVDPAHFATALGKDSSRIFEFVRDQIAYEAYSGCLRGPVGTLMAMAGNAVDRSALLARLLALSGQRVRFARGSLPEDLAERLAASIWAERVSRTEPANPTPASALAVTRLLDGIKRDGAQLKERLKQAGHPTADFSAVTLADLTNAARDHYWVQWLKDGTWIDLDPSTAAAMPGQALAAANETFDALPNELFHRVEIRVRVEEYAGGTPSSREILSYDATAADLSGIDIKLAHEPERSSNRASRGPLGALAAGSSAPGRVRPFFVIPQGRKLGEPFWATVPPRPATGAITDALGGGGDDVPTAAAEYLELEFIDPAGNRETVIREIFDRVGVERRLKGEPLTPQELDQRNSAASASDFANTVYDLFVTTGSIDAVHLQNLSKPAPPRRPGVDIGAGLRRINVAFAAVSDRMLSRFGDGQVGVCRFYLDTPRVQIAEFSVRARSARIRFDLRRSRARAVVTGFRPEQLFYAQVLRGVVEGTLERVTMEYLTASGPGSVALAEPAMSTSLIFERAAAAKTPSVLLTRETAGWGSRVAANARARVEEALARGSVVLVPQSPLAVAGAMRLAWWEVDPKVGTTIGVTDEGLHQGSTEYTTNVEGTIFRGEEGTQIWFSVGNNMTSAQVFTNHGTAQLFVEEISSQMLAQGVRVLWGAVL